MDSLRWGTLSTTNESVVKESRANESRANESEGKIGVVASEERGDTRVLRRRWAFASNEQKTNVTRVKNNMMTLNLNRLSKKTHEYNNP